MKQTAWALVDSYGRVAPAEIPRDTLPIILGVFPTRGIAESFVTRPDVTIKQVTLEIKDEPESP